MDLAGNGDHPDSVLFASPCGGTEPTLEGILSHNRTQRTTHSVPTAAIRWDCHHFFRHFVCHCVRRFH